LDPFLYLFDNYIWYLRTINNLLEDKFDGLEFNHITRQSNEAADKLAKLAFGWAPLPAGVFASDLYKTKNQHTMAASR
jgi:hypothetical protein